MATIKFLKVKGTWREVADAARTTIRQEEGTKEPRSSWKKRILLAEHSPIRKLCFNWKWLDLPYWGNEGTGNEGTGPSDAVKIGE
ncbi:MAG: hypothetical protein ACI4RD_03885 [Kiritimatiellia bacterium]